MNSKFFHRILEERTKSDSPFIVAFVGAGGKTTSLHVLGRALGQKGISTVLITTTKMGWEKECCSEIEDLKKKIQKDGWALFGHNLDDGHLVGPTQQEIAEIKKRADVILIEADGAKRMPFKVPLDHEPVLWEETDLIVLCFGLRSINQPIESVCFRIEHAQQLFGNDDLISRHTRLTPRRAALLLKIGYIDNQKIRDHAPRASFLILANQADHKVLQMYGKAICDELHDLEKKQFPARVSWKFYINSFTNEEKSFWLDKEGN